MALRSFLGRYRWRGSVIAGALALLVLAASFGLIAVDALRGLQNDHALLERVRRFDVVSERLFRDAEAYHVNAPRNFGDYARDTRLYYAQLLSDVRELDATVDAIRSSLRAPDARPELVAAAESLMMLWSRFQSGLIERLGGDAEQPRLEWGSAHVVAATSALRQAIDGVGVVAMQVADQRVRDASRLISVAMPASVLALAGVWVVVGSLLRRRIAKTVASCRDLIHGRFGAAPHFVGEDDFSSVDAGVAAASQRVALALDLLDTMQRSRDFGELIKDFLPIARRRLPLKSVGLFYVDLGDGIATRRAAEGSDMRFPERVRIKARPTGTWVDARDLLAPLDGHSPGISMPNCAGALWMASSTDRGYLMVFHIEGERALDEADRSLLSQLAPLFGHGLEKSELTERLLIAAVSGLAGLAESRDPETGNHLVRMSEYSRLIAIGFRVTGGAEAALVSDRFVEDIHRFAPMHDIGKVGVSDAILKKPGKLSPVELLEMRRHPQLGGDVLRRCSDQLPQVDAALFRLAIDIAEAHHEKFDGSGYPAGLVGTAIPLAGRIIAVADVLDALASRRPYKEPWPMPEVWRALSEGRGQHFDPNVVDAAWLMRDEIARVQARYGHV